MFGKDRRSLLNVSLTPFAHWSLGRPLLAASQGLYPESHVGDDRAKLDRLSQAACALRVMQGVCKDRAREELSPVVTTPRTSAWPLGQALGEALQAPP